MTTHLECYPCMVKHIVHVARMLTNDESLQHKVMIKVLEALPKFSEDTAPPEMATEVQRIIRSIFKTKDPYKKIKDKYNTIALEMYPSLKKSVKLSSDPLLMAVKLAIAGNIIDFGTVDGSIDLEGTIQHCLRTDITINDFDNFQKDLSTVTSILYLGDNTGEIVFDKILIEEIKKITTAPITFAVRGMPVLNDVTMEDAVLVGMNHLAVLVSNGYDAPATMLPHCSEEFLEHYHKADMIIAKGMGNYESLCNENKKIYFILKAKCAVVARDLKCNVNDNILLKNKFGR